MINKLKNFISKKRRSLKIKLMSHDLDRLAHKMILTEEEIEQYYIKNAELSVIVRTQILSEDFIRKWKHYLSGSQISTYQKLSEQFIEEFIDFLDIDYISTNQKLSEQFIFNHKYELNMREISTCQEMSEDFIHRMAKYLNFHYVFISQNLSKEFIKNHEHLCRGHQYESAHREKSYEQKLDEVKKYAKCYNLEYDDKYLYAYRNHDKLGRGWCRKTIRYEKGQYYRDWHCDMRENESCSFGLGIWPVGNTKVRVKIEDWGTQVSSDWDGKARVWGFEII